MSTLFMSDLHLSPAHPKMTECFCRFLSQNTQNIDAVYILGDFFDVWIGDDVVQIPDSFIQTIIHALKNYPAPIYFMHGNRDFLIGKLFANEANITLLPDPVIINLYNIPTLLTHGDLLCTDDTKYQQWRKVAHWPWLQWLFLRLPLGWRQKMAQKLRANSRGHTIMTDVNLTTVQEWLLKYKANQIIHGHTHKPGIHPTRFVLPDWHDNQGGALVISRDKPPEIIFFN